MRFYHYVFLWLTVITVVCFPANSLLSSTKKDFRSMEAMYQHDMDIVRLNDLRTLGGLIEEYRDKQGHYPFEGRTNVSVYVHITTKGQRRYAQQRPPYSHVMLDVKEFISEIQNGIGRQVNLPFDPQKVPVNKPNFYIYKIHDGEYFLAIHLYRRFSFTRSISANYHKVEVSNYSEPSRGIWIYRELMDNKDYIQAAGEKMHQPDYVKKMRSKMYKEGAF